MSVFDHHRWDLRGPGEPSGHGGLLGKADPPPVKLLNVYGRGSFVLGCEHAGNRIPKSLGTLGLSKAERTRHIAWDIGAAQLTGKLSASLDCPAVLQEYSRLVYDCNRTVGHPGAFVVEADGSYVRANDGLTAKDKAVREAEIYRPFHEELTAVLERRRWAGEHFAYVAVHSFNDEVRGRKRPWHAGFLYNQRSEMSHFLINWFRNNTSYEIGDNQPYSPLDSVDHTLRVQAEARSIPYTMVEVRNDLLRSDKDVSAWAELLAQALRAFQQHRNL